MSSGCLITDPPQFKPPQHTQPFLDATTADPSPNQVLVVDDSYVTDQKTITFSAFVTSQEDASDTSSAFQHLEAWLYIDYGSTKIDGQPYLFPIGPSRVTDATTSDNKRKVSVTWRPAFPDVGHGCHTVTLVVSHIFDDVHCPVCADDYSSITWQILRCDKTKKGDCDNLPVAGEGSCEGLTNTCAKVRSDAQKAGVDVLTCPDGTTDGGSP